jgi:hypothetical protein
MHSTGSWSPAVDPDDDAAAAPVREAERSGFVAGIAAGILVAAIAGQLWLARHLEALSLFVLDGVDLRSLSRLAISPLWRYGVPFGFTIAFFVLLGLRVRVAAVWATVATAAVITLVLTHVWAFASLD